MQRPGKRKRGRRNRRHLATQQVGLREEVFTESVWRIVMGKPKKDNDTPHLVDAKQAVGDNVEGKVFLQAVLVDGILAFLDSCHVVTEVPHVDLPVELVAVLLALQARRQGDGLD